MNELLPIDPDYPDKFKRFTSLKSIYYQGDKKLLTKDSYFVSVIGARKPSSYGEKTAYEFAYELAKRDVVVISGLARGIDTVAHKAALDAGGATIAIVGSGLDITYPPENISLFKKITKNNLVVSQFRAGTKPYGANFLKRNKLIAALSDIVLVVEGRPRSGTLNTARYAAEMGTEVFAVPGRIDSELSFAPNYLIENGAGIATNIDCIMETLLLH